MATLEEIENRLQKIESRNRRVELDKSWETSLTRKISITILTYLVIVVFFIILGLENPLVNAVIPTLAYMLSTISIPQLKKIWIKKQHLK